MTAFNRHQPTRPTHDPDTGDQLFHRTMPIINKRLYSLTNKKCQVPTIKMYAALREGIFPNHAAAKDMRLWLETGHNELGRIILQATRYEARKVYRRNRKTLVGYHFNNLLDLEYGLEWQICLWLRHLHTLLGTPYEGEEGGAAALDDLAARPDHYIQQLDHFELEFYNLGRRLNFAELCVGLSEPPIEDIKRKFPVPTTLRA